MYNGSGRDTSITEMVSRRYEGLVIDPWQQVGLFGHSQVLLTRSFESISKAHHNWLSEFFLTDFLLFLEHGIEPSSAAGP